jgi:hypothetical protein
MPRRLAKVAAGLLPALLLPTTALGQRTPLGPLGAEEGAPLQRLGYTPMVEAAAPVPEGTVRTDLWVGYSNIFEQDSTADHVLYLDMERMITALTLRYGLAEGLEVGARATLETEWGGFLDGFMVSFHEALGLGVRNRPDYPDGAYGEFLRDGDGRTLVDVPRRELAVGDVRLFAKWRMAGGADGGGMLAARAVVRLPTAQPRVGSERADVALMVLGNVGWHGFWLHGMAGGSTVRRGPDMLDVLRSHEWFAMAGLERPLREGLSAVVELTGSTQLLRDFGDRDVDGAPTNIVFGLVGVTRGGWRWEAGMQEDLPPNGPSVDFTIQLALGRAW